MDGPSLKRAGIFLFVGAVQFAFCLLLAEIYYPGYSMSSNYISDLGATCSRGTCNFVEPSSSIFDSSIVLLGVFLFVTSYFLWKGYGSRLLPFFAILAAIGCLGVGIFNESYGSVHSLFSALTFVSISIWAILTFRFSKAPMSYFVPITGIVALTATLLFLGGVYLGLGAGGMERMIVYPVLLSSIGFASYLIGIGDRELA